MSDYLDSRFRIPYLQQMKKASKSLVKARMKRQKKYKEGYLLMLDFLLGKKQKNIKKQKQSAKNIKK